MPQVNVSLPEGIKAWVDQRVSDGLHSSPSDFIRDALRDLKQREEALAALSAAIAEGRKSGPGRDAFDFLTEMKGKYGSRAVES